MALGDSYITLTELKNYVKSSEDVTSGNTAMTNALNSASREIERITRRQFNKATSASEREYGADNIHYNRKGKAYRVAVDDFHTTTDLVVVVDDVTLTSDEYKLFPRAGIVDGQTGWPYTHIQSDLIACDSEVLVTAQWGWSSVPDPVKQACFILAGETYKLSDALLGVAGVDEWGFVHVKENRAANAKLARYRRKSILVG